MHIFCLLTSMELIPIPNCSLYYLHSNDIKNLKSFFLKKKVAAINITVFKKTKTHNKVCV